MWALRVVSGLIQTWGLDVDLPAGMTARSRSQTGVEDICFPASTLEARSWKYAESTLMSIGAGGAVGAESTEALSAAMTQNEDSILTEMNYRRQREKRKRQGLGDQLETQGEVDMTALTMKKTWKETTTDSTTFYYFLTRKRTDGDDNECASLWSHQRLMYMLSICKPAARSAPPQQAHI